MGLEKIILGTLLFSQITAFTLLLYQTRLHNFRGKVLGIWFLEFVLVLFCWVLDGFLLFCFDCVWWIFFFFNLRDHGTAIRHSITTL